MLDRDFGVSSLFFRSRAVPVLSRPDDDTSLIRRVIDRDPGADGTFLERHRGLILGLARGRRLHRQCLGPRPELTRLAGAAAHT